MASVLKMCFIRFPEPNVMKMIYTLVITIPYTAVCIPME